MRQRIMGLYLVVVFVIAGCASKPAPPSTTVSVVKDTSSAGRTLPLIYNWSLGEKTVLGFNDISFAVLGIQLSESESKAFFLISGKDIAGFLEEYEIFLTDNLGQKVDLISIVPLGQIEKFNLGMMRFGPRLSGATELFMHLSKKGESTNEMEILLAQFDGPPSEDRLFSTYFAGGRSAIEVDGSRIRMIFTLPISEAEALEQLPVLGTAIAVAQDKSTSENTKRIPWIEAQKGAEVYFEYSISIENVNEKQIRYLAFQLLSDGNVVAAVDKSVIVPAPIYVATPTPQPYPEMDDVPVPTITSLYPSPSDGGTSNNPLSTLDTNPYP